MKVHVIDGNGTEVVIDEELGVESEEPISGELRRFLDRADPGSGSLDPEFLIELYVRTPVRRVEPAGGGPERARWDRRPVRYGPPTGDPGGSDGGCVDPDGFAPDAVTPSPSAGGADE